ncbi:hypothetical protein MANES_15G072800v8 [Manihot esculenta]|uniref:Uncharacterized protein n=1 Tax=Manihot esculenta TaxID=3983 RepID=A0ACB7GE97_MANES|nr:hypothetical protein MANES_15G072800v8 [Manihot esculenta]
MAAENISVSIASKIAELLVEPIVHQLRYIFCFSNIAEDLKQQEKNLTLAQDRVQNAVDAATRNAEEIEKDVLAWLTDANKALEDAKCLENEKEEGKRCFSKWCPYFISRYRLSRKMAKKGLSLSKLQEKGNFSRVFYYATLPCIEFLSKDFMPSESSKLALNRIMEALRDDNVNMIGLYGMGGVGKTTLVKEVGKQVNQLKLFDEVLMVVISQAQDLIQIQDRMADKLYLDIREKSKEGRASRIWKSLKNKKKILIILDDIWRYLDLKEIGIPLGDDHKGCKVLLTTRLQHVCISMDCQREIPLHHLTEDEAWALFKKNAGVCDDSSSVLNNMAVEVARECKGLPIAIVTMGRALRGKNLEGWEAASQKLKKSRLTDIRDVDKDENAYACLKSSFDYLQREQTKLCFLLCSLFPEDCEIFVEDLVRYTVALGLYVDAQSIEETRSEVCEAICVLQASSMLLETESEESVKMHDVFRDFALWIGSKMENGFKLRAGFGQEERLRTNSFEKCTAISLMDSDIREVANWLVCPQLKMLLLLYGKRTEFSLKEDSSDTEEGSTNVEEGCNSIHTFFEGMKELQVLSIAHEFLSTQSLEFLTNLHTLQLKYCSIATDLTSLKYLKKLMILDLHGSPIKELPEEIGELNNLRLLDLADCQQLKRIPPSTIQRLSKLEELYIGNSSFCKWGVEGTSDQRSNASLMELNSLSHLAILWLYINDKHIPRDFAFPNLNKYCVEINSGNMSRKFSLRPGTSTSRCISISDHNINTPNVLKELFLNVYDLSLDNSGIQNIIPEMDQRGFNHLIQLSFFLCSMKCLISTMQQQVPAIAFSNLQRIHIGQTILREICDGEPPEKFLEKLQTIEMFASHGMLTLFPAKLWRALQNLETVVIQECDDLQEVFQLDGLSGADRNLLSKLVTMRLESIPKLRYIWKGPVCHVNLKSLTYLKLDGCDRLTFIFSPSLARSLLLLETLDIRYCNQLKHVIAEKDEEREEAVLEACEQPVGLQNLKTLKICGCDKLEYVFPISFSQGLLHLEEINIQNAIELKHIFSKGKEGLHSGDGNDNMLHEPRELELSYSSNPSYFCSGNYVVVLPFLKHLEFEGCPKLSINYVIKISILLKESTSSGQARVKNPEGIQLKTLIITGCAELEHIIVKDDDERDKVSLQNHIQSMCFTNLLHIEVYRCNKLKRLFPIAIAQGRYHFVFPCLETLTVQGCPLITTRFTIAPNGSVHAKAKKTQIVKQDVANWNASTLGSANEEIEWNREQQGALPAYMEDENEAKALQVVEDSSNGNSRPTNMIFRNIQGMGCCLSRGG